MLLCLYQSLHRLRSSFRSPSRSCWWQAVKWWLSTSVSSSHSSFCRPSIRHFIATFDESNVSLSTSYYDTRSLLKESVAPNPDSLNLSSTPNQDSEMQAHAIIPIIASLHRNQWQLHLMHLLLTNKTLKVNHTQPRERGWWRPGMHFCFQDIACKDHSTDASHTCTHCTWLSQLFKSGIPRSRERVGTEWRRDFRFLSLLNWTSGKLISIN